MSDFKAKMHQIRFLLSVLSADTPLRELTALPQGAYSAPPEPLAVLKGSTSKGREGKAGGEGEVREGEGKRREGKVVESCPQLGSLDPPVSGTAVNVLLSHLAYFSGF